LDSQSLNCFSKDSTASSKELIPSWRVPLDNRVVDRVNMVDVMFVAGHPPTNEMEELGLATEHD